MPPPQQERALSYHEVYQQPTQEQNRNRTFETPLNTQFYHEHLYNPHSLLISKTNCAHMDRSAQLTLFKNAYIELS